LQSFHFSAYTPEKNEETEQKVNFPFVLFPHLKNFDGIGQNTE